MIYSNKKSNKKIIIINFIFIISFFYFNFFHYIFPSTYSSLDNFSLNCFSSPQPIKERLFKISSSNISGLKAVSFFF